jgi:PAS domain S-box-containing protein
MTHNEIIKSFRKLSFGEKKSAVSRILAEWQNNSLEKVSAYSLLDIVPDGIVVINDKGEIIFFNKQAELMFGYEREDVIGQRIEILKPQRYQKSHHEFIAAYFNHPSNRPMGGAKQELFGLRKNGEEFSIDISLSYLDTATGKIAISNIREINEKNIFHKEHLKRIKAEVRLQKTLDSMIVGCMIIGFDWTYLYVNEAAAGQGLQKPENLVGKTIMEIYPGVEETEVFRSYRRSMEDRIQIVFEEKYTFSNGVIKWYEFHVEPVDEGIFVISDDVTEKKNTEANILKHQELLRESQRIAHLGSWELDHITDSLIWSDETFRIFEIEPKLFGASYKSFLNIIHPEDKGYVNAVYTDAIAKKNPYDIIYRLKLADGRIKYLHSQAKTFYDTGGKPIRTIGNVHDITKEKEAEILLERNEKKYKQLVENINDGLVLDNLEGRIVFANKQFLDMFAMKEADLLQLTFEDYVAPEYKNLVRDFHNRRTHGENVPSIYEFIGLRSDGERRRFEVNVTSTIVAGNVIGTQSIVRDITTRKLADEERNKMMNEILQRNKDLEQFSYMLSHNLRSPVANIMAITNFMKEPNFEMGNEIELVHGLYESVDKLDSVIKDINNILHTRRQLKVSKERVIFNDLVENIKISIFNLLKKENATIICDFAMCDEMIGVKSYLHSIFFNLILNSIKYRQEAVDPIIYINSFRNGETIEIVFEDNGLGINLEKHKDEIFGLYKRFHYHTEGKGLGLYMIKSQVELMGGKIYVDSKVNIGTTFRIIF